MHPKMAGNRGLLHRIAPKIVQVGHCPELCTNKTEMDMETTNNPIRGPTIR